MIYDLCMTLMSNFSGSDMRPPIWVWYGWDGLMNNDIDDLYALKAGCLRIMEKLISGIPCLEGDRLFPCSWVTAVALMPFGQVVAIQPRVVIGIGVTSLDHTCYWQIMS